MPSSTDNQLPPRFEQVGPALLESACASITDIYGNIVYVSDSFCKQSGYSRQELIGNRHSILRSNNHPDSFYDFLWATLTSGNVWKGEICNTNKRGELYWIEREITPIFDDNGKPEFYLSISNDISSQKSLVRKLKNRAQQQGLIAILGQLSINSVNIQLFVEQTLAAVTSTLDMQKGLIFKLTNDGQYASLLAAVGIEEKPNEIQLNRNDLLGYAVKQDFPVQCNDLRNDTRFDIPDYLSSSQRQSAIALSIGDRKNPCGAMLLLSSSRHDITVDDAHFAQSIGNLISEAITRHKIETELLREKELSRKYLDVADIIMIAITADGNITLANQKASSLFGLEQDDLIGLNLFDYFVPFNEREKVRNDFTRYLRGEPVELDDQQQGYQSFIITRQAKTRLVKWNNAVIHDEAGGTVSLLCAGEDITEVVQARQEKDKLQEELYQAQKMEALGILAGGIAHDFNNILASILGYTDLAIERFAADGSGKLAEYLKHIKDSGIRARDIIEQMRNYNRPGHSGLIPVALPSLIKDTLKMLRSAIPSTTSFEQHLDVNVPAILIDPSCLSQLVMKLIINARNAVAGSGCIKISIAENRECKDECASCGEDFAGHYVQLTVSHSGTAMDLNQLDELFSGNAQQTENQPLANSLASIHRLVHESNGHIRIHSSADEGTDFSILFPVATATDKQINETSRQQPNADTLDRQARIMIVDDESSVASFLGELFNQYGFITSVYTDPTRALEDFTQQPENYDLVMTDQTMPLLSGDQLAQKILTSRTDIPVILCTGYSDIIDEQKAAAMNIQGFLRKPVQTHELLECVYNLLGQQPQV